MISLFLWMSCASGNNKSSSQLQSLTEGGFCCSQTTPVFHISITQPDFCLKSKRLLGLLFHRAGYCCSHSPYPTWHSSSPSQIWQTPSCHEWSSAASRWAAELSRSERCQQLHQLRWGWCQDRQGSLEHTKVQLKETLPNIIQRQ